MMPLRVTGGRWQLCPFFFSFSLFPYPLLRGREDRRKNQPWLSQEGREIAPSSTAIWMSQTLPTNLQGLTTDHRLGCNTIDSSKNKGRRSHTVVSRYRPGNRLELVGSISGASSTRTRAFMRHNTHPCWCTPYYLY